MIGYCINFLKSSDAYMRMYMHIYNLTTIGSEIGLSHGRRSAIIWTKLDYFNWNIGNKLQTNFNRNQLMFILEYAFQIVTCKMATILSRT